MRGFLAAMVVWLGVGPILAQEPAKTAADTLFARDNLVAWCIVPFDSQKRGPEARAAMLAKLGFRHFAYDWRAEHIPTFDAELESLQKHHIELSAFWAAGELNADTRLILATLKKHEIKTQLWVLTDAPGGDQAQHVAAVAEKLLPLAREADKIGCTIALYNHGGWFGEPENQLAIIAALETQGVRNVGMVYNLHHGHAHLNRFAAILKAIKPHLLALNLNGMDPDGDLKGRKILPLGQGSRDLDLLKIIVASGYTGRIGILGHTDDDAEQRLQDNLDGLDWLVAELDGKPTGSKPRPRTMPISQQDRDRDARVKALALEARQHGDATRGADVFAAAAFACATCHKVAGQGGNVGPDLSAVGQCMSPEQLAESVLYPNRQVKAGFSASVVATHDGRVIQGYPRESTAAMIEVIDTATNQPIKIARVDVESVKELGSLMPAGLAEAMTPDQRRDVVRFLMDLGKPGSTTADLAHDHAAPAHFAYDRQPLHPENWPNRDLPVNRERVYDFYAKEAEFFRTQRVAPGILPPFPGLDGGTLGHWGNQNDTVWVDDSWNRADLGTLLSGVFRGGGATVPKGVCVRMGDRGELSACFNPEKLTYDALWSGGFLKFSSKRHGFLDGLMPDGTMLPRPDGAKPTEPFRYHGFYRSGKRVIFAYKLGEVEMLDAPWVEDGKFTRTVGPAATHPLRDLIRGGAPQWPQTFATGGKLGEGKPYAVDTINLPVDNPWKAPLFLGGHDFLADGTAILCTIQGDVWRVEGLDASLQNVRWRRFATGLHQALGLVVDRGQACVLGRDQITKLHDLNGDGEADFYENVSNAYGTSPAGHDFICGLQRDAQGNFYTASGRDGVLKIAPDGLNVEVVATGFRNPDGVSLSPTGILTVPCSEGEWTPASEICEIRPGGHYGYRGPIGGKTPDYPLMYLPRGLDNSAGEQTWISDARWGLPRGLAVHLSHGAGSHFLLLRDVVGNQAQGAVVPMPGDFRSGIHRGRFAPHDGQLYVSGSTGWGTYTPDPGCFQRVRLSGDAVQAPVAFHAHENGVLVEFARPIDREVAQNVRSHFAQSWNYRYSSGYGSPELSPRHPGMAGHDPWAIRSAHVLADGRTLFLEIPAIQPVNQLQLRMKIDGSEPRDLFATINALAAPFSGFPGYTPQAKTIAAHPMLVDLANQAKSVPNPWRKPMAGARTITIEAGKNLTFSTPRITVKAGEPIHIAFFNPDVVPHNWALIRPGTLPTVGDLVNKIVAEPDAAARHYIPQTDDIVAYTDTVFPDQTAKIDFLAPTVKGNYPFLCTFPGHWMVMNGVMVVE